MDIPFANAVFKKRKTVARLMSNYRKTMVSPAYITKPHKDG